MGQSSLPLASGGAHARTFERLGWTLLPRRGRGKHFLLTRPGFSFLVCLPDHPEVKRALLAKQIKNAGLTEVEYCAAFNKRH